MHDILNLVFHPNLQTQEFFQGGGGGGGSGPTARKQSGLLFSPQLILQFTEGVQWFYYRENNTFPRIQLGGGGGGGEGASNFFQGVISIETHITCDFPGGFGPPIPPFDPHMKQDGF